MLVGSRYSSATAALTEATVFTGSLRNTPSPSAGISIPLFNLYTGLFAVAIVNFFQTEFSRKSESRHIARAIFA
jgi:uncharacterized membrane protein YcfT